MPKADKKEEDDDVSSVEIDDAEEAEPDEATSNDLTNPDIVTKYRTAGDIANKALAAVLAVCVPGKLCVELCNTGDDYINEAVSKIYNQKKDGKKLVEKGIAFPTCISVNNCVGHYSPLVSEDKVTLVEGDLVKIDLGVHVDGYVAVVAHTALVGGVKAEGRKADVIMAAWTASEVAQRMLKEGAKNNEITKAIATIAESFKCTPVEGVLSHQMKRFVIDANKTIINKMTAEQQVPENTIDKNDVFAIDVVMSTGEGKPKQVRTAHATRSPPPESLEAAASAPAAAILAAAARAARSGPEEPFAAPATAAAVAAGCLHALARAPRAPSRHLSPLLSSSLLSTPARVPRSRALSRARSCAAAAADCRGSAFSLSAQLDDRTTVHKRNVEEKYSLKMKASRAFFSEVRVRAVAAPCRPHADGFTGPLSPPLSALLIRSTSVSLPCPSRCVRATSESGAWASSSVSSITSSLNTRCCMSRRTSSSRSTNSPR